MKEILLQHKAEKERILSKNYVAREKLAFGKMQLDNDLIKVIVGPRRAGKSIFSFLLLQDKRFAYLNFDDEKLRNIADYDEIVKSVYEVYPDSDFIFFDEIQNLPEWELFVNKLHRRGYNLVLTGSNARLLSSELATALTGRHVPIEVLPFSFREFLDAKDFDASDECLALPEEKGKMLHLLESYLRDGGMPEVVVKQIDARTYLETLLDSVLFKDVVKRHKVKFAQQIYDLAVYLLSNFGSEQTSQRLKNVLSFRSISTVQNYVQYLSDAFLVFVLNRFSYKVGEQVKAPRKMYVSDTGFVTAGAFQFSANTGRLMENAVFIELVRRGCKPNRDLFYYKTKNNREVDFATRSGLTFDSLIQVCYDIDDPQTWRREINALLQAKKELQSSQPLIITWDEEREEVHNGELVHFSPLWKWLLSPN
ncbi:MAG: ATP-binding protein [bacterium]